MSYLFSKIRNPNLEIRNKLEIRITETQTRTSVFEFWSFDLFRIFLVPKLRFPRSQTPFGNARPRNSVSVKHPAEGIRRRAAPGMQVRSGDGAAKRSFAVRRSQTEFGNESTITHD